MNLTNLLSYEWQRRMLITKWVWMWSFVWILSITSLGLFSTYKYLSHLQTVAEVGRLEKATKPLYDLVAQTTSFKREINQLQGRQSLLAALESSNQPFLMLGIVSKSARNVSSQLTVDTFEIKTTDYSPPELESANQVRRKSSSRRSRSSSRTKKQELEQVQLILQGSAQDDLSVSEFVTNLRSEGVFDSVVLYSSDDTLESGAKRFHVGCDFIK